MASFELQSRVAKVAIYRTAAGASIVAQF
eukprot:COSAG01_NODE_54112_length_334_cov_0.880851_2_plen_28_part_01